MEKFGRVTFSVMLTKHGNSYRQSSTDGFPSATKSELEEVYATERHLLYVACTRARDHLLVTGVHPASEFLGDLEDKGRR